MLKRTKGRLLLTLLVITGFAGTLKNGAISQKERKQAVDLLKKTRDQLLHSVRGLSEKQVNYRPSPGSPSIADYLFHLLHNEQERTDQFKKIMDEPSDPQKRLEIARTDHQLIAMVHSQQPILPLVGPLKTEAQANYVDALVDFMKLRDDQLEYIKTSTEDLRNHVWQTAAGWMDAYQYFLVLPDESACTANQIEQIKRDRNFPKK